MNVSQAKECLCWSGCTSATRPCGHPASVLKYYRRQDDHEQLDTPTRHQNCDAKSFSDKRQIQTHPRLRRASDLAQARLDCTQRGLAPAPA